MSVPDTAVAAEPVEEAPRETRHARAIRLAHRARLHIYAVASLLLLIYIVALAAGNTQRVSVHWVFGSSRVSLVWPVLIAGIAGWLLGVALTTLFRWRTRKPRD